MVNDCLNLIQHDLGADDVADGPVSNSIDNSWFIYKGELHVGLDIRWALARVEGHDRHRWFLDDMEMGKRAAESLHQENVWMQDRAVSMLEFYELDRKITLWMASPEGEASLATAREVALANLNPTEAAAP